MLSSMYSTHFQVPTSQKRVAALTVLKKSSAQEERRPIMRAIVTRNYGGPEALELIEVPIPDPEENQVRIKVEAATVNPVDILTRNGLLAKKVGQRSTVGLGWDVAGTIDALGSDVTDFTVGQKVIGMLDTVAVNLGTYADYVVISASAIASAPSTVNLVAA